MNMSNFNEMYASLFRKLTDSDGLTEWQAFVNRAEPGPMREALDAISDHHRRLSEDNGRIIGAPRLGEVRAAYERALQSATAYKPPKVLCMDCNSSGWAYVIRHTTGAHYDQRQPVPGCTKGYWAIGMCPCHCAEGATVKDCDGKPYPPSLRDTLRRYHVKTDYPGHPTAMVEATAALQICMAEQARLEEEVEYDRPQLA